MPGATHLFPESGALETVAMLAVDWFSRCLSAGPARAASGAKWRFGSRAGLDLD